MSLNCPYFSSGFFSGGSCKVLEQPAGSAMIKTYCECDEHVKCPRFCEAERIKTREHLNK
ncbi:hypothetical protein [Acetivibrio cellulolyticus]|uniref:hypothetical protein n=1 Tax=Acetivibrio cellulolyticus TaxID=35830 RepID=UPI0001E2C781|nr:hypothetical protein [Acetivibrio cellulolyticus]